MLSRKSKYGLKALLVLAREAGHGPVLIAELARREAIPKKFLEKIIQDLIHHGIVRSTRGAQGGYTLARAPETVTFKDVIEAIEGPVSLNVCVGDNGERCDCSLLPSCTMLWVWREAQARVMEVFTKTTLADVQRKHGGTPPATAATA